MTDSSISYGKGGTTFSGPDAVNCFNAMALAGYLKLYAKTGIVPTRGVNGKRLLEMATSYTKKKYKRGQHEQAAADVREWALAMKAALPKTDEKGEAIP